VCHVSAVSRGRSPGNYFPQLGPQLFVITGEAVTSRSRSSPILMGWWFVMCNDFTKVLIAAGKARQNHQQCKGQHKEKDHRSGSDGFSENLGGFHPLPEPRCALRFKNSAHQRKYLTVAIHTAAFPRSSIGSGRAHSPRI